MMADLMGAAQMLDVFARKYEEFSLTVENKHLVWLREIEEEARRMFSSDFNAEPELMPKTPSQKRRRKKARPSLVPDEDSRRRLSRQSNNWRSSIRRLSMKLQSMEAVEEQTLSQLEPQRVTRQTRAKAQKAVCTNPDGDSRKVSEQPVEQPSCDTLPCVKISTKDRKSAEEALKAGASNKGDVKFSSKQLSPPTKEVQPPALLESPTTPEGKCRSATKVKIAASTPKEAGMNDDIVHMDISANRESSTAPVMELSTESHEVEEMDIHPINLSDAQEGTRVPSTETSCISVSKSTPTGSKSDRRSVRRSLVGRHSRRHSLMDKYSLASKRESMTREAMRKSIRRSISKKAWESSASSYQSSTNGVDEDTIKTRPELIPIPNVEEKEECPSPRRSLRSRNAKKIAISNLSAEVEQQIPRVTRQTLADSKAEEDKENVPDTRPESQDIQSARRKSYKRAIESLYDDGLDRPHADVGHSPPRKKTPSPPCPNSKVVRPPPAHLRTFLHTVQKNQLLMSTPGSGSSSTKGNIVKSFIKRTTPLKTDNKSDFVERERQRLENLRRKQEAEIQRKLKMEEEKKRKLEELKLRREERQRKVLQARERVEQIGEEKKRKIEQKCAQIDEKSEKVREDRLAEEKAKKKLTAKKMEEVEVRRRQDEETRRQKIQQMEEEERKHQEVMQKKREEEEQERAKKMVEAKKLAEQRQAEQERERQREQQLAADKELERQKEIERIQAEKERERQEKERTLQVQREQERAARDEAAAQERERLWKETEERKRKEQQEQLRKELEQERHAKEEQERRAKEEQERRLREERRAKEEREAKAKEQQVALVAKVLNVTLDVPKSPASESYKMTPQGSKPKPPKICDEDYGIDINSGDSTDDESEPRKPIPSWASGKLLTDAMRQQFYNPINVDRIFGRIESPKLEEMFYKNKPRYLKRTSSAVWHSPPLTNHRSNVVIPFGAKKY